MSSRNISVMSFFPVSGVCSVILVKTAVASVTAPAKMESQLTERWLAFHFSSDVNSFESLEIALVSIRETYDLEIPKILAT